MVRMLISNYYRNRECGYLCVIMALGILYFIVYKTRPTIPEKRTFSQDTLIGNNNLEDNGNPQNKKPSTSISVYKHSYLRANSIPRDQSFDSIAFEFHSLSSKGFIQESKSSVQQLSNGTTIEENDTGTELIDRLTKELEVILNYLPRDDLSIDHNNTCVNKISIKNSCNRTNGCLRTQLPRDLRSRIEQLVRPSYMRPSEEHLNVLDAMRDSVDGQYNIILATAASSNHYLESKALLANLHSNVFPYLSNFTMIYYDIGLEEQESADISAICKYCQIRKFPFWRIPDETLQHLKCFAWKPIIISAHISQADILYWMDASVRFHEDPTRLRELLMLATIRGMQGGSATNKTPLVTLPTMFHFFGDEPCAYHHYSQCQAGTVVYHNEPLVTHAVLMPWLACAFNKTCMCPGERSYLRRIVQCSQFSLKLKENEYNYGVCHRFDQSALSIIIRKLFQEKSHHILNLNFKDYYELKRGDLWKEDMAGFDEKVDKNISRNKHTII